MSTVQDGSADTPVRTARSQAVFFDRDGVVNVSPGLGYVIRWEDFRFFPGIIEALRLCKARGYKTVLVTNQQGVGKGLMTRAALDHIHERMQQELARQEAAFDSIQVCPHLEGTCCCRKPSPQMIFEARDRLDLNLGRSWLVGDQDRDIQMAANAGVPNTIRIVGENEAKVPATMTVQNIDELVGVITKVLPNRVTPFSPPPTPR